MGFTGQIGEVWRNFESEVEVEVSRGRWHVIRGDDIHIPF